MIIREKNIIFVHIPKTAGQSVTKFLLESIGKKYSLKNSNYGLIFNNKKKLKGPTHYHHLTLFEYKELGIVKDLEYYYKFAVFRNPYKRFQSIFNYNKNIHLCTEYKQFIKLIENKVFADNALYRHTLPQTWYVDYNLNNLDDCFFVEKISQLEKKFKNKYGFEQTILTENQSIENKIPLDNYTINFINKYYEKDFELLGYKYETP